MRSFLIIVTLVGCGTVVAQYLPNSNQAFQFASVYNPAFTGVEACGDLKLGYRYQWSGFGANAPKFINILYNLRLNQPGDLKRNSFRTSIPEDKLPKNKRFIHAMGSNLFNEKVGVISRFGGGVNYSLHYPIFKNKNIWIATGTAIMLENTRVDLSGTYLGSNPDPDSFYDRLLSGGANRLDMNIRAGVLMYAPNFYFGFSYLPVWNNSIQSAEGNFTSNYYRGTAQAGISFPISPTFNLKPSIFGVWQIDNQMLVDYSMKIFYQERIWLGLTYRSTSSGVGLIGFNLNKMFVATYSYEVPTNAFQQFSNGSHELVLAIRLNNLKACNPYVW